MGSPVPGGTAGDCSAADQHRSPVDWLRDLEQRRHRDRRRPDRLGRSRGRAASAHPGCGRRHRRRRPRGEPGRRPGHARADRRPHPPGVRGQPLGGARHAVQRLVGRGDHRRGRRGLVHRHRDPRHRPLDAVQRRARPAGPLAAVRHDDPRGQDRVPPDQGRRAGRRADAARSRKASRACRGCTSRSWPRTRSRRSSSAVATTTSTRSAPGARTPLPSARTAWTCTARKAGSPRTRRAGSSARAAARACCRGCTPAATPAPAPPGWPPRWAAPPPTCCTRPTEEDVAALAQASVAAVVCPGTALQTRPGRQCATCSTRASRSRSAPTTPRAAPVSPRWPWSSRWPCPTSG